MFGSAAGNQGYVPNILHFFSNNIKGDQQEQFLEILQDSLGYLAMANINRIANLGEFPDFDSLINPQESFLAKGLSMMLAQKLLKNRQLLTTPEEACQLICTTRNNFLTQLPATNENALILA